MNNELKCPHCGSIDLQSNSKIRRPSKGKYKGKLINNFRCKNCGHYPSLVIQEENTSDKKVKSYLFMGCLHLPFQNRYLMDGILKLMDANKYDGVIFAGDFLDMGALGQYEKGKINHTGVTLKEEYDEGNILLDEFDKRLSKDALKVFLWGNHCDRYWRWLADVNNSKLGAVMNPTDELKLIERGYIVKDKYKEDFYKLGSLYCMHGEYYNIHSAKKHLDEFKRNTIYVHTHRSQMHREGDFCAWNTGFMGNINAPCFSYAGRGMKGKWANGFAIIHIDENNNHYVDQINCIDDKFVCNGVIYGKDN